MNIIFLHANERMVTTDELIKKNSTSESELNYLSGYFEEKINATKNIFPNNQYITSDFFC